MRLSNKSWFGFVFSILLVGAAGCGKLEGEGAAKAGAPNGVLAVAGDGYNHKQHLDALLKNANRIIATNPPPWGVGSLSPTSPLRRLLGIPDGENVRLSWWRSNTQEGILVHSKKSGLRLGKIAISLSTGLAESVHDVTAFARLSEMQETARRIVPTRGRALWLFGNGPRKADAATIDKIKEALRQAFYLPSDAQLEIRMSAPGGTNGGTGRLTIYVNSPGGSEAVAVIGYPRSHSILSLFGIFKIYRFGGISLRPAWERWNTGGFSVDSQGVPFLAPNK